MVTAEDLPEDGETAVAEAFLSHPQLRSAVQTIRSMEHDLRAAGAPFLPSITFDLTGSRNENPGGADTYSTDVTAMVNLSYNLYRGGADKAALGTSKALLAESRLRLEESRRLLEQGARVAFNAYQSAVERFPQLEEAAAAAAEALEDFASQFELGERTVLDRLTAEDQWFAAQTGIVNGRTAVLLGHYQVLAAMGQLRDAFYEDWEKPTDCAEFGLAPWLGHTLTAMHPLAPRR